MSCINNNKDKNYINNILIAMLLINLFIILFPVNRGSIIWNFLSGEEAYNNILIKSLTYINFLFSLVITIIQRKLLKSNGIVILLLLIMTYFLSKVYNLFTGDMIGIIAIPIEYLTIYIILSQYSISSKYIRPIKFITAAWLVIPVILFLILPASQKLSYVSFDNNRFGSFGGYALHRNYFGYYAGLIILLFLMNKTKKMILIPIVIIGIIGIFISTSRSAFICLLLSVFIYFVYNHKKYIIPISLIGILFFTSYYHLSNEIKLRSGDINRTSDREELIYAFSDSIKSNPILGLGKTTLVESSTYPNGAQAHNFIFQVWSDYGILSLIFFCLFWLFFIVKGDIKTKVFIIYLMSFGLFQPYFMLNIPPPFIWINVLFIILTTPKNRLRLIQLKSALVQKNESLQE